jgi:microcystin-dependent protein
VGPANLVAMSRRIGPAGGPHNNLQPYLTFFFCIACGRFSRRTP